MRPKFKITVSSNPVVVSSVDMGDAIGKAVEQSMGKPTFQAKIEVGLSEYGETAEKAIHNGIDTVCRQLREEGGYDV